MTPVAAYAQFRENKEQDTWHHLPYFREIAHGNILEIGVNEGASTSAFLFGLEQNDVDGHLYSVDIRDCSAVFAGHPQWTFIQADSNLEWMHVWNRVPRELDIVFIDGNHSYQAVAQDLHWYGSLVKPGGLLLLHDILPPDKPHHWGWFPGVGEAAREWVKKHGYELTIRPNSWGLGVIRIP